MSGILEVACVRDYKETQAHQSTPFLLLSTIMSSPLMSERGYISFPRYAYGERPRRPLMDHEYTLLYSVS